MHTRTHEEAWECGGGFLIVLVVFLQVPDVLLDRRLLEPRQTLRVRQHQDGRDVGPVGHPVQAERPHAQPQSEHLLIPSTITNIINMVINQKEYGLKTKTHYGLYQ